MHGARLVIDEPTVLTQVVTLVDGLRLDRADADTKGDLFEHVLKQIKQAGELGQFRTPRHVIRAIVEIIDPRIGETVYDPAAGTAGFLVAAYNHIRLANSSPAASQKSSWTASRSAAAWATRCRPRKPPRCTTATFFGNDVDPKMVRLATMNLTLRGLPNVRILLRNVLTTTLDAERKAELGLPEEGYHVVLANPPFSGRVDRDRIVDDVKVGTTTATELLFLKYMMDSLRPGGRCGVIVPEGVLFGSTGAHKELRRQLIENNRVEAVLSLPGGVFQPYSGREDLGAVLPQGRQHRARACSCTPTTTATSSTPTTTRPSSRRPARPGPPMRPRDAAWESLGVRDPKAEWTALVVCRRRRLRANDFNLSASRYRPMSQTQVAHRDPRELLDELAAIEAEIAEEVKALRVRPYLNKVLVPGFEGKCSTEIIPLLPSDAIDRRYLAYFLRSAATVSRISAKVAGARMPRADMDFVLGLELPLPPLAEQRRIVDLLARAEGIMSLRREAQAKAQAIIPALFLDMFGDPATNPRGWPVAPLSEVAQVISGIAKGRKLAAGEGIELPYMRVANVKDGYLDLDEVKTIEVKHIEVDKLLIQPGDLLMTEGGDPDKLGRAALWSGEIDRCVHQNHIFKVRSDRSRVLPFYLRTLASSTYGKAYFLSVAKKTTGIASINKTQLSAFPVVLPPQLEQVVFTDRVASIAAIVLRQTEALKKAETAFQALSARAFGSEGL
jgi:type I restriction enzyme M protein